MAMEDPQPNQKQGPLPRTRESVDWWLTKWGRKEVVDGKEPLARQDVEQLIEVNGGTAEGLDLGRRNLTGIHLTRTRVPYATPAPFDLRGVSLVGANLSGARLFLANLRGVHLEGANLYGADLSGANLHSAHLQTANLRSANLLGADLRGTYLVQVKMNADTNLEGVTWDERFISVLEHNGQYQFAVSLYRQLKQWYQEAGMPAIAGEFHYREREASRKDEWQKLGAELQGFKRQLAVAWGTLRGREVHE